jgi:hypothetical protein
MQEWDNEDMKVCTDEEVNDDKNQTLLSNSNAYGPAITIINAKPLKSCDDKNSALKVLEKLYIFLIMFVKNNQQNQHFLSQYIDMFLDDIEYGVHSWELIAEIFKNSDLLINYPSVTNLLKKVIKHIDSLPKETPKKTTMLSFLGYFI